MNFYRRIRVINLQLTPLSVEAYGEDNYKHSSRIVRLYLCVECTRVNVCLCMCVKQMDLCKNVGVYYKHAMNELTVSRIFLWKNKQ